MSNLSSLRNVSKLVGSVSALALLGSGWTTGCGGSEPSSGGTGGSDSSNGGSSATTGGTRAGAAGSKTEAGATASGGASSKGGTSNQGGAAKGGSSSGGRLDSQGGSSGVGGGANNCGTTCASPNAGACSAPQVRITEVDVGSTVLNSASETELKPLVLAAMPGGGSRLAWMGNDKAVHIAQLDCDDKLVGAAFSVPAHDFQDIAADAEGGVVMLTRDAKGGGTLNCGNPSNLCDGGPNPAVPCYDMFMVRFDCTGKEQWATLLTTATADLPPYSTGKSGATAHMIWWYQHHGRIAHDGSNYAAYFCDAISVSEGGCINIHQGDRMQVVGPTGSKLSGHDSFEVGCSHSGFTRIVWDPSTNHFVMACKTDNDNRIAMPNPYRTVYPISLDNSYVGDLVLAKGGGYWLTVSNGGSIHLLHFSTGQADKDITLASANYPHLAAYGPNNLLASWGSGSSLVAQVRDAATGAEVSPQTPISVSGNPYTSFESYPDGSVAYAAPGTSSTKIKIARVLPCGG
jgi:hypothetical protein